MERMKEKKEGRKKNQRHFFFFSLTYGSERTAFLSFQFRCTNLFLNTFAAGFSTA